MATEQIICDHGNVIELSVIDKELNISIVTEGDNYQRRTAPLSSTRQIDALIYNLKEVRKRLK